ncbi:MAG TPA: cell division protein SepF [Candidatus Scubalenecus merdavium]|uniref:Cell division protein SepF n=1 Tax=Candidatus Scybalenecus merdavium TaxID=2840939 RepID=A0A9D1MU22_9FIRM|nr:cell division protein SepF [Candidatus Scubalenecus merdavium]
MGFFEKWKEIISDNDDDELYGRDTNDFVDPPAEPRRHERTAQREREREYDRAAEKAPRRRRSDDSDKVVNIHTTAQLQVVLVKPEKFDEAPQIADNLNERRTVVLNLESANRDIARRLLDFLSGVAYANGGKIKRVANSTYIITPYNVDVMGDLLDELENNGMFM